MGNELEIALDHSNKSNSDLQKHIKKLHTDVNELQNRVSEQQRLASEFREQYGIAERRANALHGELEESRTLLEQSDRGRRQAEADLADGHDQVQTLSSQNGLLANAKRKLEGDMQAAPSASVLLCRKRCFQENNAFKFFQSSPQHFQSIQSSRSQKPCFPWKQDSCPG